MQFITDDIVTYIYSRTNPYADIKHNVFPGASSNEIIIRPDPSPKRETEYFDESAESSLQFEIQCKADKENQETARAQLETFIAILNMAPGIPLTDATFVKCECVAMPSLVSYDEAGEYILSATFRILFS